MCVQWVEKEVWTGLSNSAYAHISKTTRILHIELNIFAPIYSIAISDHSMQTAFSHCVSILHFWLILRERARCTRQCKIKCENGGDASVDLRRCALYRSALSAPACGGRRVPVPPRTNNNAHELTRWAHLRPWGGRTAAARRVPTRAAVRGAVSQRPPPEFPSTPAPTELSLFWSGNGDRFLNLRECLCVCISNQFLLAREVAILNTVLMFCCCWRVCGTIFFQSQTIIRADFFVFLLIGALMGWIFLRGVFV